MRQIDSPLPKVLASCPRQSAPAFGARNRAAQTVVRTLAPSRMYGMFRQVVAVDPLAMWEFPSTTQGDSLLRPDRVGGRTS